MNEQPQQPQNISPKPPFPAVPVLVGGIVILLGVVGYLVWARPQAAPSNSNQGANPTPTPSVPAGVNFEESLFSLKASAGWIADHTKAIAVDAKQKFYYEDKQGNYFQVNIDPDGSDFGSDSVWRYKVNTTGDGVAISSESPLCKDGDGFCSAGDNKLHIYLLSESPGSVLVQGHDYYFIFGNSQKEAGVELQVFRDIISSFRAKANIPTGWKTYSNFEYGFEISYPASLLAEEASGPTNFMKRATGIIIENPEYFGIAKRIEGAEGPPFLLDVSASEPYEAYNTKDCGEFAQTGTVALGGISAKKCEGKYLESWSALQIIFTKDDKVFYVMKSYKYSGEDKQIADKILSTFKFTN